MKFFGTYGCSAASSVYNIAIEARDAESALKFCYDSAVEDRDSYEGLYGIETWVDIAENEGFTVGEMSPEEENYIDDAVKIAEKADVVVCVMWFLLI